MQDDGIQYVSIKGFERALTRNQWMRQIEMCEQTALECEARGDIERAKVNRRHAARIERALGIQ